jgi:RNA polymerase sigma factor (sigma-70 family)
MSDAIGSWLNNAARYPLLSQEETIYIARRIKAAEPGSKERAKWVNKLCLHNLRLVANFTRSYVMGGRSLKWNDDKTLDLLQQGYLGLRRAAEKYDPERGYSFSTYANAWVRQSLGKYHVTHMSLIRVPESTAREIFYYERHGKPRTKAVGLWIDRVTECARAAYAATSFDDAVLEDTSLMETISTESNLTYSAPDSDFHSVTDNRDFHGVMSKAGIEPQIQDLVLAYCRRGNLDTVLMRYKCNTRAVRTKVREAVALLKEMQGVAQ